MRSVSTSPHASMDMPHDPALRVALERIFREERIDRVVETGTHVGLGSTTLIAEVIVASGNPPPSFFTIESNSAFCTAAEHNLRRFAFVRVMQGCSLREEEMRAFLFGDEALRYPDRFPDILLDDYTDPPTAYLWEAKGSNSRYDLLRACLRMRPECGFICLDSAGGIGLLEYRIVCDIMRHTRFFLLIDDIDHIKHFRSAADIRARPDVWRILAESPRWMLAEHAVESAP